MRYRVAQALFLVTLLLAPQVSFALGWYAHYPQANLTRYQEHLLAAYVDFDPIKCTLKSSGAWTIVTPPKNGKIRLGLAPVTVNGLYCKGMTFVGAALYYTWEKHNNKSISDAFLATWQGQETGGPNLNGRPTVPIVRPIGETTEFIRWQGTTALYRATLKPPTRDPKFDFSGETVREVQVGTSEDDCWSQSGSGGPFNFQKAFLNSDNGKAGVWKVGTGNKWEVDGIGYSGCQVHIYMCMAVAPACGFAIRQEMQISAPPDNGTFHKYAENLLVSAISGGAAAGWSYGKLGGSRAGVAARHTDYVGSSAACSTGGPQGDFLASFRNNATLQGFQLSNCLW